MSDLSTSLIRTATPLLVGLAASLLLHYGVTIDGSTLTSLITIGLSGGYYTIARFLEAKVDPKYGKLLGSAKPPDYSQVPALAGNVVNDVVKDVPAVQKVLANYGLLDKSGRLVGTTKTDAHTLTETPNELPNSILQLLKNGPGGQ